MDTRRFNKTVKQRLKWWWTTRVLGLFRLRLKKRDLSKNSETVLPFAFKKKGTELEAHDEKGITVILTAYRRVEYLPEQIESLRNQTIPPKEIWVWCNDNPEQLVDVSALADRVIVSNTNWLFWGRFALGNLARTGYVAFFDDDTLPQPKWFENCLNTIQQGHDCILGGSGVILPIEGGYSNKNKVGWNGRQSNDPLPVDLVGHAWFFHKKHLQYIWREEPISWDNGEDIHLSYMALKHGNIKTIVPPHPESDPDSWSCRPDFGKIVGNKNVATCQTKDHRGTRSLIVDQYRNNGWQIVEASTTENTKTFSGDLGIFNLKLKQKENFSLVRFGDGEMVVINGEAIDLSKKKNGEHRYTPGDTNDEKYRQVLSESLTYNNEQYYVGIPCRCCVGDDNCDRLITQSEQPIEQLTWANIFVNSNYPLFIKNTVPILEQRTTNIICHHDASFEKLPFNVKHSFRVGANAWSSDYNNCLQQMTDYINKNKITDEVFIFCAGVLSNMLIYQLTKKYPDNTYLDVGSVFDVYLGLGKTRKYLKGSTRRLKKVCIW